MAKNTKKSDSTGFAERLKQLRLQKNLSQSELANLVSMRNKQV